MDSDEYVEIAIDGTHVPLPDYSGDGEYEIIDSLVNNVKILLCMNTLRNASSLQAKSDPRGITLTVILENEKLPWENNIFGAYFDFLPDGTCEIEFSLNTAIGTHDVIISDIVESSLANDGYSFRAVRHGDERPLIESDGWHSWSVQLSCLSESETFASFFKVRRLLSQAVFLPTDLITTPYLAMRVVQIGHINSLVGHQESEWLEAKSAPYDFKSDEAAWKLELAKDVAQFANSNAGGLLVIGLHTKRVNGTDTIDKVTAFPHNKARIQSYRDVLRNRIHPPITGLQLDMVQNGELCVMYVFVPPQPEENKPYLITGSLIEGTYEKFGITIVRRHGDASIPVTAQELHSMIAAGRAFLRGQATGE
jgi:Putative DNA-binding domain